MTCYRLVKINRVGNADILSFYSVTAPRIAYLVVGSAHILHAITMETIKFLAVTFSYGGRFPLVQQDVKGLDPGSHPPLECP